MDFWTYTPFPRVRFDGGPNQNVSDRGVVSTGPGYICNIFGPNQRRSGSHEKVNRIRSEPFSVRTAMWNWGQFIVETFLFWANRVCFTKQKYMRFLMTVHISVSTPLNVCFYSHSLSLSLSLSLFLVSGSPTSSWLVYSEKLPAPSNLFRKSPAYLLNSDPVIW